MTDNEGVKKKLDCTYYKSHADNKFGFLFL